MTNKYPYPLGSWPSIRETLIALVLIAAIVILIQWVT